MFTIMNVYPRVKNESLRFYAIGMNRVTYVTRSRDKLLIPPRASQRC